MRRQLATLGGARQIERPVRSIASLAFVGLMAAAFWAGAVYIGEMFISLGGSAF